MRKECLCLYDMLRKEDGFSSAGAAIALLLTLTLIFSTAQIYRINSVSSQIQDVADAAALAAENQVAEFMVVVRVCDAVSLTLRLSAVVCSALGVAALCTPLTASASEALLAAGKNFAESCNKFSTSAASGLEKAQKALPFLAAVRAMTVAKSNNASSGATDYLAIAILCPWDGESIVVKDAHDIDDTLEDIDEKKESIKEKVQSTEELQKEANEAKQVAFEHDCGSDSYCMYERAETLAGLSSLQNPLYKSVDTWTFSVALNRAKAYYPARLAREQASTYTSLEDKIRSALRIRFYTYAAQTINSGYVHETGDSFAAYFPTLPKNTAEMRETSLYTEAVYPVTVVGEQTMMHACDSCPLASDAVRNGSISEMEAENYPSCPYCGFSVSSLGQVAGASSRIENGFEYHYIQVAEQAERYEEIQEELSPLSSEVKETTTSWMDKLSDIGKLLGNQRISATPPGSYGAIAFVVNLQETPVATGLKTSFVSTDAVIGARAAVSGATLLEDDSDNTATVITSLLNGVSSKGLLVGAGELALGCWSSMLAAYGSGQDAITSAIENVLGGIPLIGGGSLGSWASKKVKSALESIGLQPADLSALKPVIVNTSHIASKDESGFGSRYLSAKSAASALQSGQSAIVGAVLSSAERKALQALDDVTSEGIEIATIEPFGSDGTSIPITLALPDSVKSGVEDALKAAFESIRNTTATTTEVGAWE